MKIDLEVELFSGLHFTITNIDTSWEIFQVKIKISEMRGFHSEQIQLMKDQSSDYLPDNTSIDSLLTDLHQNRIKLYMMLFTRMIPIKIIRPDSFSNDLIFKTYPGCTIFKLKSIIQESSQIPIEDQNLTYNSVSMMNDKALMDYNIRDPEENLNNSNLEEVNITTTTRPFEITLVVKKNSKGKFNLGIDFSFNTIKNVKKISWKYRAPWFREVTDGFSLFCYCRNSKCKIANELFIINRGYLIRLWSYNFN